MVHSKPAFWLFPQLCVREAVAVEVGRNHVAAISRGDGPPICRVCLECPVAAAQDHLAVPTVALQGLEYVERAVAIEVSENHVVRRLLPVLDGVNWTGGKDAGAFPIERPDFAREIGDNEVRQLVADVGLPPLNEENSH
jgi:hypothetical protein